MKRYCTFFLVLIFCLTVQAENPNIIFILSDDVGIGDVQCYYPAAKVRTPNINRLASQGMRFTQAYAPGSVCSPSRYGLLTGEYPCRGPVRLQAAKYTSPLQISTHMVTLPKFLKNIGYRTAHIGKWHLGYGETGITNWAGEIKPGANEIGFDYTLGLPTNHSDNFKTYVENHRLLWLKEDVTELPGKPTVDQLTQIRYDDEVDSTLTAKALDFIKQDPDKPFFIYLALVATHTHVTPHKKFRGTSEIGQLGDYIHELDFHVGEIMDFLDYLDLADNTILIFASDNGGQKDDHSSAGKNLHLRDDSEDVAEKSKTAKTDAREKFGHRTNGDLNGYKGGTYEGGFRIPFIIRWPGHIAPGTESDQMITLADTLATAAGLINQPLPDSAGADSFDLSPVMLGQKLDAPIRTTAILQTGRGVLAFRDGDWKIFFSKPPVWGETEVTLPVSDASLYNLADDPRETVNLAEKYPERTKTMTEQLIRLLKKGRSR